MSKYTTEVRFICETYSGLTESKGFADVEDIIDNSVTKIFDFNYPIFDENYRLPLEKKIISHYYTREICAETVGLWKLWLKNKMNEIMPYYNQLYLSELIEYNPLYDTDLTTTKKGNIDETKNANTTKENKEHLTGNKTTSTTGNINEDNNLWNKYSDTPQGGIDGLEKDRYLTNATHDTEDKDKHYTESKTESNNQNVENNGNEKTDSTMKSVEDYITHVVGKNGGDSYSKRIVEFRNTFLNIDMLIIDELADLFFNLW